MLFGITQAQHAVDQVFREEFRRGRREPRRQVRVANQGDAAVGHLHQANIDHQSRELINRNTRGVLLDFKPV